MRVEEEDPHRWPQLNWDLSQEKKSRLQVLLGKSYSGTPEREGRGSRRPSCLSAGGAGGAKVPFLNAMICFPVVNMIQQRSYKLKTSNIWLEKAIIYMTVRGIAYDIPKKVPRMPSISGIHLLAEGSRCLFAPVCPPCSIIFPACLVILCHFSAYYLHSKRRFQAQFIAGIAMTRYSLFEKK